MSEQSRRAGLNDARVAAAVREYLERLDRGEPVNREKFIARHADISEALRSFITAEEQLRKLGDVSPRESAGISTRSMAAEGQETVRPQQIAKKRDESTGGGNIKRFGRYRMIRALGSGAMGNVYLAEDTQLQRQVALKMPRFENDPKGELTARFYREARAAATLRHANICPVYDVGEIDGKRYISMAYIEGQSLSALIHGDESQTERQILIVMHKLAQALQEAHDYEIVHRDLKPANIMIDMLGEPIIMDFGLARKPQKAGDARLTHSGMILGTPAYMSPEQAERDPDQVGPASDQYSLGVIFYEMLTGQLPFRGSIVNVLAQILTKEPQRPSALRAGIDPRIEAICLKMMAKKASDRFPSMKAVAHELATILKNPAARSTAAGKPATAAAPVALDPSPHDAGKSQILKSVNLKVLTESDLASLEELVRKCLARRDYDQMIQIVERIPEERRNAALQKLLEKAQEKADEIAFLICEIDEADRIEDGQNALRKAEELLKIKPGHRRAREVQQKYAGHGTEGAARIGPSSQLTQYWSEGGWIPWSVLAFGLAVFAVMCGVMVFYIRGTWIAVDVQDPGIEVGVKGSGITITGPEQKKVTVEPGEHQLKISYAGLETLTKSFELKSGEKPRVRVSIVDKKLVAEIDGKPLELMLDTAQEKVKSASGAAVGANRPALLVAPFNETTAKKAQNAWADRLNTPAELTNTIGMKFRLIPPGEFMMGSSREQADIMRSWGGRVIREQLHAEQPQIHVAIRHPYYLGAYEVTRANFTRFVTESGYKTDAERDGKGGSQEFVDAKARSIDWRNPGFPQGENHAVVNVSTPDAEAFCEWLSRKEGRVYRLPREAEWEFACRAGTTTIFYTGDDQEKATRAGNMLGAADGYEFSSPVGVFPPNPFGLYDMYGSAWEICRDWGTPDYKHHTAEGDPPPSADHSQSVSRGGAADCPSYYCRSASRDIESRSLRQANIGFRVVCEIPESQSASR